MPPPLFILSLPRSFSTVASAMLGRHPQMYAVPELCLFIVETMDQWLRLQERSSFRMKDGLLRTVAEVYFGGQTESTIPRAWEWIRQRSGNTTAEVCREIARKVEPEILVEKSPVTSLSDRNLKRVIRAFPDARFLLLTRHPRGYCESVMHLYKQLPAAEGSRHWLAQLVKTRPPAGSGASGGSSMPITPHPQHGWAHFHTGILRFLERVPAEQQLHVRGEELLRDPDLLLPRIADWLGISTAPEAIEEMKHPERSPFARVGPDEASAGGDPHFFRNPQLRPATPDLNLDDPLEGENDGIEFSEETRSVARRLGYH